MKTANTIAAAFVAGRRKTAGHARTDGESLSYRGNTIARKDPDARAGFVISSAGWETATTKRYLNALPSVRIHQHQGEWYLNGVPWSDSRAWTDPVSHTPEEVDP